MSASPCIASAAVAVSPVGAPAAVGSRVELDVAVKVTLGASLPASSWTAFASSPSVGSVYVTLTRWPRLMVGERFSKKTEIC